MPDFPVSRDVDSLIICPASAQSLGREMNAMGLGISAAAWPTANKAIYVPFSVYETITVRKMFWENGGSVSGNVDVGIYDINWVRLVSSGSTAQAGTSAIQEVNITDTTLASGIYYLAMAMDNNTGQIGRWGPTAAIGRGLGVSEEASAFPLPSTATLSALASGYLPGVFATLRVVV